MKAARDIKATTSKTSHCPERRVPKDLAEEEESGLVEPDWPAVGALGRLLEEAEAEAEDMTDCEPVGMAAKDTELPPLMLP